MQTILLVAEIVAPVFILAGLGFGWVRAGLEYRVQFVSRLAMRLALPCLMFQVLRKTELSPDLIWAVAGASVAAHLVLIPIFWALVRAMGIDIRTYLAPLIFGNTGNLGLPLALFAFGQAGLEIAVIVFAVSLIIAFTVGIWIVAGEASLGALVREPAVFSLPLAVLFMAMDWTLPRWADNTLDLVGQMLIPMMLMTLGVALSRLKLTNACRVIWLALLKLAICFACAWAVAGLFALPEVAFAVLVVQMCTPVAVTAYLIAENYLPNAEDVAGFVVVSTLLSVVALPTVLSLFVAHLV